MFYKLAARLRNRKVLPYITARDTHLDIGCGDGWLLDQSPTQLKHGIHSNAEYKLQQLGLRYTVITLVAVVEHLDDPALVLRECCRLLTPEGRIIITAPTWLGNLLTIFISPHDFFEHKRVVTPEYLRSIVPDGYRVERQYFELRLNQLFIIEKEKR